VKCAFVKVRLEVGVGDSVVRDLDRILYRVYLGKQANTLRCLISISSYLELILDLDNCRLGTGVTLICTIQGNSHVILGNRPLKFLAIIASKWVCTYLIYPISAGLWNSIRPLAEHEYCEVQSVCSG